VRHLEAAECVPCQAHRELPLADQRPLGAMTLEERALLVAVRPVIGTRPTSSFDSVPRSMSVDPALLAM
jgi:hypothetical protein